MVSGDLEGERLGMAGMLTVFDDVVLAHEAVFGREPGLVGRRYGSLVGSEHLRDTLFAYSITHLCSGGRKNVEVDRLVHNTFRIVFRICAVFRASYLVLEGKLKVTRFFRAVGWWWGRTETWSIIGRPGGRRAAEEWHD